MSDYTFDLETGKTLKLLTAGKYCDRDIVINAISGVYTWLNYIETTGTQYINTGIIPTDHFTEVRYDCLEYDNDEHIFGTDLAGFYYHFTTYNNKYFWGITQGNEQSGGSWSTGIKTLLFNYGENHAIINDGVTIGSGHAPASTSVLKLFAREKVNFKGRLYYCKITDRRTGELVRNLVPVRLNANSEVGLYDRVNDVFYANAGTGSFTGG